MINPFHWYLIPLGQPRPFPWHVEADLTNTQKLIAEIELIIDSVKNNALADHGPQQAKLLAQLTRLIKTRSELIGVAAREKADGLRSNDLFDSPLGVVWSTFNQIPELSELLARPDIQSRLFDLLEEN